MGNVPHRIKMWTPLPQLVVLYRESMEPSIREPCCRKYVAGGGLWVLADLPPFSSPSASCVWVKNVTRPLPPPVAMPCFSCPDRLELLCSCKLKSCLFSLGYIWLWYFITSTGKYLTHIPCRRITNLALSLLTADASVSAEVRAPARRNTLSN